MKTLYYTVFSVCIMAACQSSTATNELGEQYRGVLQSPGGELAFPIYIDKDGEELNGYVINGADTAAFTDIVRFGDSVRFSFSHYDSHLQASVDEFGSLRGEWYRFVADGERISMPFKAKSGNYRYRNTSAGAPSAFEGEWEVTYESGSPARGMFTASDGALFGTFLTEIGDHRFLEGTYTDSTFILSAFDGAFALLYYAELQPDGTLTGDFWSRDTAHEAWTAQQSDAPAASDPFGRQPVVAGHSRVEFSFPDINGNIVSHEDERFQGKPLLLYLFGSWCPNCADETRLLRELYDEFSGTDLEIVGLAYEYTGDFDRDAEMVGRYKERFDIPWTLLVAGSSDKEEAAETLPFLDEVIAYPTALFIEKDHSINAIHTGFNGPGTGSYYFQEVNRYTNKINEITQ
ncbi:MAG: TlpA disulfide reductase family protein [Balneolales bacterium]